MKKSTKIISAVLASLMLVAAGCSSDKPAEKKAGGPEEKVLTVYSARSAATGSFFAAFLDGIRPPISVRMTLRIISRIALPTGRTALIPVEPVRAWITALPGINRSKVIPIPINPEQSPTIKVSALNT